MADVVEKRRALQHAAPEYKADCHSRSPFHSICDDCYALQHAAPEHNADSVAFEAATLFVLKSVKQNGCAFKHAAPEHKGCKVVPEAVKQKVPDDVLVVVPSHFIASIARAAASAAFVVGANAHDIGAIVEVEIARFCGGQAQQLQPQLQVAAAATTASVPSLLARW